MGDLRRTISVLLLTACLRRPSLPKASGREGDGGPPHHDQGPAPEKREKVHRRQRVLHLPNPACASYELLVGTLMSVWVSSHPWPGIRLQLPDSRSRPSLLYLCPHLGAPRGCSLRMACAGYKSVAVRCRHSTRAAGSTSTSVIRP
jgi:hypothetical protein